MADINKRNIEHPLSLLVGRQLSAVVFVQDYVQLQFDGIGLSAITDPVVRQADRTIEFGMAGYRDGLCENIAKIVRAASLEEGREILIEFDDTSAISISLRPEDYRTAEAAILYNGPEQIWVW
jgi:hypothetical protein